MTNIRTLNTSEFQSLFKTVIGANSLISDAFATSKLATTAYPPYNIIAFSENDFRITVAVAGFAKEDINIVLDKQVLTVTGERKVDLDVIPEELANIPTTTEYPNYLHRGIAARNFERVFKLLEYVSVTSVSLKDGMLTIDLKRELPEALKPRVIDID